MTRLLLAAALLVLQCFNLAAQKKIVVLGSSTAAGYGSTPGNSWVERLQAEYRKNTNDGLDTNIINYAVPGYVTYQVMPSDFVLPPDRSSYAIDVNRNVTKALESPLPDVVIINLPSNDVNITPNYNMQETMNNFRLMYQKITSAGVRCFITTTMPRTEMPFVKREMLANLRDSILNNFGPFAINFFDVLSTSDGQYNILPQYNSGDNVHVNDAGHAVLFNQVRASPLFVSLGPLPIRITSFAVRKEGANASLKWSAGGETAGSYYEIQKSSDGRNFTSLQRITASANGSTAHYSYTDPAALAGRQAYRIRIEEGGRIFYSQLAWISGDKASLSLLSIATTSSEIRCQVAGREGSAGTLLLTDGRGTVVYRQQFKWTTAPFVVNINRSGWPAGNYFLQVSSDSGESVAKKIMLIN